MVYNAIIDKISNLIRGLIIVIIGFLLWSHEVNAATVTTTFNVTATVVATCTVSATNMAFGNYQFTASSDATSTINVNCTPTTQYKVGLSSGANSANVTARLMSAGGSNTLAYFLYRDNGRTQNWGNTPGTDTVDQTGTGAAQNITVYGRINSGAISVPGNYSDTVTVTVTF